MWETQRRQYKIQNKLWQQLPKQLPELCYVFKYFSIHRIYNFCFHTRITLNGSCAVFILSFNLSAYIFSMLVPSFRSCLTPQGLVWGSRHLLCEDPTHLSLRDEQ